MTDIRVPTLGESITEATIGRWFKKPGDAVAVGDEDGVGGAVEEALGEIAREDAHGSNLAPARRRRNLPVGRAAAGGAAEGMRGARRRYSPACSMASARRRISA